jgi:hypothetical protein
VQPTAAIVAFLREIGFEVRFAAVPAGTVLPGIDVERGALVVDEPALLYPGDLLHEAGHLAVLSPARRRTASGRLDALDAQEMAAIAWSYAAARHLAIDPAVVFHPAGYRGSSPAIIENFGAGRYFGVPILGWLDMTSAYPVMTDWLNRRDDAWPGDEAWLGADARRSDGETEECADRLAI